MSHFTRVKTKMVEKTYLVQALTDLGYHPDQSDSAVKGFRGSTLRAELKIASGSPGYDIGFVKNNDTYEIVADWWGVRGLKQQEFVEKLTQRYAYHTTKAQLELQGFTLVEETQQRDGRIHLLVRRAV